MEESKGISSQFVGNLSGRGGQASVTDQPDTVIILRSSDPIIQHAVSDAVKTMKYFGFLRKNTSAKGRQSKQSDLEASLNMRASYAEPTEQAFPSSPKSKTAKKMFSPAPKYAKPQSKFEPFVQERDSLGHLLPVQSRHNKRTALSTLEMSSAYNLQKNTSFLEMASILDGPKLRLGSKYFQLNPDANLRLKAHIAACRDNSPVIQFQTTKPVDSLLKSHDGSNKQRMSLQTTPTKKRYKSEISLHALIPREDSVSSKKLVVNSPQVESDSKVHVRRLLDYSSNGNFKTEPKKGSVRFQSIVTRSFDATGEGGLVLKLPDHSIHNADPIQNEISFKPIHAFSPSRKSKSNARRQTKALTRSELTMREHGEESGSVCTPRSVEPSVDGDTSIKPAETLGHKLPDIRSHDKPYRHSIVEATRTQPTLTDKQGSGNPDWRSVHNLGMAERQGGSGEPSLTSVTHLTSSAAKVVIIPRKQSLSKLPEAPPVVQSPFLDGQLGTRFTHKHKSVGPINAYFSKQERLRAEVKNTTNYAMKEPSQATLESKSIGFKLLNMEKDSQVSTPIDVMTSKDLEYIQSEGSRKPSFEVQEVRAYRNLGLIPMLTPLELEHVTRARVKELGRVVTRENIEDRKKRQLGKSKADLSVSQVDFKGKASILA